MTVSRRTVSLGGLGLLASTTLPHLARAEDGPILDLLGSDEFALAVEAYTFGYPLVTMEMTRRVLTNVAAPEGTKAPMGQLIKVRQYPDASFKDVTAPNADTLYTTAFLDVGPEPWVVSLPDLDDRYALFPMLDGWTTVFDVPGKRTTGTKAQTFAITGPGWSGTLPEGVTEYKSPTSIVWFLGRIYCTGTPEDYAAVHKIQDQIKLVPLGSYGKTYKVTLPKDIPAEAFWSFTLYDNQTRSMLQTPQKYPRAGSQNYPSPAAEAAADGSTTVYFGPTQPEGVARGNWIQTDPKKGWFTILRLYSPLPSFFDKSWRPSEIELSAK